MKNHEKSRKVTECQGKSWKSRNAGWFPRLACGRGEILDTISYVLCTMYYVLYTMYCILCTICYVLYNIIQYTIWYHILYTTWIYYMIPGIHDCHVDGHATRMAFARVGCSVYCQTYGHISKNTWSYMTALSSRANSSQKMTQVICKKVICLVLRYGEWFA